MRWIAELEKWNTAAQNLIKSFEEDLNSKQKKIDLQIRKNRILEDKLDYLDCQEGDGYKCDCDRCPKNWFSSPLEYRQHLMKEMEKYNN